MAEGFWKLYNPFVGRSISLVQATCDVYVAIWLSHTFSSAMAPYKVC